MAEGVNDLLGTEGITDAQLGQAGLGLSSGLNASVSAKARNTALEAQIRQTDRAVAAGTDRAEKSAAQQRLDRSRESAQLRDRLRVTQAETGLSVGTLDAEASIRLAENIESINLNLASQKNQLFIGGAQSTLSLQLQQQNPFLAGIGGALTGVTAAMQIEGFTRKQGQTIQIEDQVKKTQQAANQQGGAVSVTTSSTQPAGVFRRNP